MHNWSVPSGCLAVCEWETCQFSSFFYDDLPIKTGDCQFLVYINLPSGYLTVCHGKSHCSTSLSLYMFI